MNAKQVFCTLALLLGAALFTGAGLDLADAQNKAISTKEDKKLATKEGIGGSLGQKEFDEDKLPGTLEIGMAVGSCIVMIAVVKWL